jgi:hypothetical protein
MLTDFGIAHDADRAYQRYTTASFPPVHLIQRFAPSCAHCMMKFAVLLGSQFVLTVLHATAPGADTDRGAVLALPYVFQYASSTDFAKKHDVSAEPRPECVPNPVLVLS